MSVKVVYNGIEDFRHLGPNDFKFHSELEGVEDLTFPRGVEVEVSKEVRDALLEKPHIYGNFVNVPRGETAADVVGDEPAQPNTESAPANSNSPENNAQTDVPNAKSPKSEKA